LSFGWREIQVAARRLARRPSFALIAIATLALGIGATTALWSVVDAVLLEPLPYRHPERLVRLFCSTDGSTDDRASTSIPDYLDWVEQSKTLSGIAAMGRWTYNLATSGPPQRALGGFATRNLFPLLGVPPLLGRTFSAEEDRPGGPRVAVLSYGLWQSDFGGRRDVLGRQLLLDEVPYTIVGVMPPGFDVPSDVRFWTPFAFNRETRPRNFHFLRTVARLAPGATLAAAREEMSGIARRLERRYPDSNTGLGVRLVPFEENLVGKVRPALLTLFGAAILVLLIACGNLVNLLLARAAERRAEIALCRALGAGRRRLFSEMLVESSLLALPGGAGGVLLAYWGVKVMVALSLAQQNTSFLADRLHDIPRLERVGIDAHALVFALVASLSVAVAVSLAPMAQVGADTEGRGLGRILNEGGKGEIGRGLGLRRAFIVAEVALALVVVVGAGLLVRSYATLVRRPPGFAGGRTMTLQISLPLRKYAAEHRAAAFYEELLRRVEALPGVTSAGLTWGLPLSGIFGDTTFDITGHPQDLHVPNQALVQPVSPRYFETLGIPLLRGRLFDARDGRNGAPTVIVNEALARRYFHGENPLGQQVTFSVSFGPAGNLPPAKREVIGVVGDTLSKSLRQEASPELYFPYLQGSWQAMSLAVRTTGDPARLAPALREQVWALDRNLGISDLKTMDGVVSSSVAQPLFNTVLLLLFAAIALILAAIGIYGIISYWVSLRSHEIGVRMALGARPQDVARQVLWEGTSLALLGLAIGLVASLAVARVLSSLLFGVSPADPLSFVGAAVLFLAVAGLASYLPARRATRVDPLLSLRSR
jgi:putative ABC transport system permease protein